MTHRPVLPNLIILGPQGSGKGTQAQWLAKKFGYTVIGMGQLLRDRAAQGDALGQDIRQILARGHLVSDETLGQVLGERLKSLPAKTPLIFDGVPRDIPQVAIFEHIISQYQVARPWVIALKVSRELVIERIKDRQICKKCGALVGLISRLTQRPRCSRCDSLLNLREDDRAETINQRLNIFYAETIPVIEHFRRAKRLIEIEDEGTIEQVHQLILDALPAKANHT